MNIYLIGLPASGKTTVAKALANALEYTFIDLDTEIEKDSLMFIESIFEKHGEETFRKLEAEALQKLPKDNTVIACGGGIVEVKQNKEALKGLVIYLDVDLDVIKKRIEDTFVRPILKLKSLEVLAESRFFKYRDFADYIVSNEGSLIETVEAIVKLYEEKQA